MIIDYTAICSCGYTYYGNALKYTKEISREHVNKFNAMGLSKHEIYIDKNNDLEIDDTFKSIIIN